MKKIKLGIDISKEKLNLCYLSNLEIVSEEEVSNDVKTIKNAFKDALKALTVTVEDVLVCAEYTGQKRHHRRHEDCRVRASLRR